MAKITTWAFLARGMLPYWRSRHVNRMSLNYLCVCLKTLAKSSPGIFCDKRIELNIYFIQSKHTISRIYVPVGLARSCLSTGVQASLGAARQLHVGVPAAPRSLRSLRRERRHRHRGGVCAGAALCWWVIGGTTSGPWDSMEPGGLIYS